MDDDYATNERGGASAPLVLSLGSINADFQVRVERRPDVSETVPATDFARLGGGKAANVAYLACRLGVAVRLFGHVGDDDLAEQALSPLREVGVDLADVKSVAGVSTGVAMISVPPDGKKGIVLAGNANNCWSEEDIAAVRNAIDQAPRGSVLVLDCEIPLPVLEAAARAAKERGHQMVLDPSPAKKVTDSLLTHAAMVVPNASEAEQLTGVVCSDSDSTIEAGRCLLQRGAAAACIKLPDGGCMLVERHQATHITSEPVQVVDTTGAGDAFAGALAVGLVEQRSLADAVRLAVAASHLAVTGYGSQAVLPDWEQLRHMTERLDVRPYVG